MTKFISFLFLDIDVSVKSVAEILCLGLFPVKNTNTQLGMMSVTS